MLWLAYHESGGIIRSSCRLKDSCDQVSSYSFNNKNNQPAAWAHSWLAEQQHEPTRQWRHVVSILPPFLQLPELPFPAWMSLTPALMNILRSILSISSCVGYLLENGQDNVHSCFACRSASRRRRVTIIVNVLFEFLIFTAFTCRHECLELDFVVDNEGMPSCWRQRIFHSRFPGFFELLTSCSLGQWTKGHHSSTVLWFFLVCFAFLRGYSTRVRTCSLKLKSSKWRVVKRELRDCGSFESFGEYLYFIFVTVLKSPRAGSGAGFSSSSALQASFLKGVWVTLALSIW